MASAPELLNAKRNEKLVRGEQRDSTVACVPAGNLLPAGILELRCGFNHPSSCSMGWSLGDRVGVMALLHPAAPDALIRWGFAASIFQTTGRIGARPYLTVPIANKVAEEHPELMQQFQEKLKSDASFAADPQARLDWWISRSNYQPSEVNRYPVLEVWEKDW